MEDSPKGWRACYRHPKKPASCDCAECGKPICGDCKKESGDPALCPACKEAAASDDKAPEAPLVEPLRLDRPPLTVSEVTIHDDGHVEAPRKAKKKAEVPRDDTMTTPPTKAGEEPLMAGLSTQARPPPTITQLKVALPYGLMAAIGVLGFWLILALARNSWTQWAVFTTGIAVPWALTKGSTVRKRAGIRVWKSPPHPAWIGLLSVGIMLPLVPLAEYLAYKILSRGTDIVNPGSKFMSLYFNSVGIFFVAGGFVLAFGIPFLLRIGEGWRAPSLPAGFKARVSKLFKGLSRRTAK